MSETHRIDVLEEHIRRLTAEVTQLRGEVTALRGSSMPVAPPPMDPPAEPQRASPSPPALERRVASMPRRAAERASGAASALDLEAVLGRYGTIALASLAILMGVGTFLTWAIAHGLLSPTVRVVLGGIAAIIVAWVGVSLRQRGDVRYGNTLLALALAIVHVDAWAAGPGLHVLPTIVAFGIAGTASIALSALALTSDEATLFTIGFAGALLAPFVTSDGHGNVYLLGSYGWVVIASGIRALRGRVWRVALSLTVIGAGVYALVLTDAARSVWPQRELATFFLFAGATVAAAWGEGTARAPLAVAMLGIALISFFSALLNHEPIAGAFALAVAATLGCYAVTRELTMSRQWRWLGAVALPLGFLVSTVLAFDEPAHRTVLTLAAVGWSALAALAAWDDEEQRGFHLVTAAVASALAVGVALETQDVRCVIALTLHAALFATIMRRERCATLALPIALELLGLALWSMNLLEARHAYEYAPFLTPASLAALAVVLGAHYFGVHVRGATSEVPERFAREAAPVWQGVTVLLAYGWGRMELAGAVSPDVAIFLVILYDTIVGLALIWYGRWKARGLARAAGLVLAYAAGVRVLVETWHLDAVALRVGSRILVGIFLAAVSYWYRARAESLPAPETSTA